MVGPVSKLVVSPHSRIKPLGNTWKPELPVKVGAARHGDVVVTSNPAVAACTQFPLVRLEAITDVNEPRFGVVAPIVPFNAPEVELSDEKAPEFAVSDVNAPVLGPADPMGVASINESTICTLIRFVKDVAAACRIGANNRVPSNKKAAPRATALFFMFYFSLRKCGD